MAIKSASISSKKVSKPAAKTVPKPKTSVKQSAAKKTSTATKAKAPGVTDKVALSKEAGKTDKAEAAAKEKNLYDGIADSTATVTVDPYKEGKNDTIEGMLRNQGFSLQDIYNKDKGGKTLIDHVAGVNKLKNPNVIQDGAKLKIPSRANSESLSSMDLKKGEQQSTKVENKKKDIAVDSKMEKKKDGSTELNVGVKNDKARGANLESTTTVGKDSRVDSSATATKKGVEVNTVAQNADGSAVNQERIVATPEKTEVTVKDIDKRGDNMKVKLGADQTVVSNPGSKKAGDITTVINSGEKQGDGFFERTGAAVSEALGFGPEAVKDKTFEGVGRVTQSLDSEQTRTTSVDGKVVENRNLDADDGWLERRGEDLDDAVNWVGDKLGSGVGWLSDTLFGSGPDASTEKSKVKKSSSWFW